MSRLLKTRPLGRAIAALAIVFSVSVLFAFALAPSIHASPVVAAALDAGTSALIDSSEPVTLYLPLVLRIEPAIITFFDDFSDPNSGWPISSSSICNPYTNEEITEAEKTNVTYWRRRYLDGEYQFLIPPANASAVWFCQPDALAPWIVGSDVYTVETSIRYAEGKYGKWDLNPWWDNAGLIFGANGSGTQLFMICLGTQTYDNQPRTIRWTIHANVPYPYKKWDAPDKPYKFPYRGCSEDLIRVDDWRSYPLAGSGYNHLTAAVNGDNVKIYINGVHDPAWEYYLPGLSATTRVGLIGGDYEFTPSDIRADWFRLTVQYGP